MFPSILTAIIIPILVGLLLTVIVIVFANNTYADPAKTKVYDYWVEADVEIDIQAYALEFGTLNNYKHERSLIQVTVDDSSHVKCITVLGEYLKHPIEKSLTGSINNWMFTPTTESSFFVGSPKRLLFFLYKDEIIHVIFYKDKTQPDLSKSIQIGDRFDSTTFKEFFNKK